MKEWILVFAFFCLLPTSSFASSTSCEDIFNQALEAHHEALRGDFIYSLYAFIDELAPSEERDETYKTLDPRTSDLEDALKELEAKQDESMRSECRVRILSPNLSAAETLTELFGNGALRLILSKKEYNEMYRQMQSHTFMVANISCGTHNYTRTTVLAIENSLTYGIRFSQSSD